MTLLHNVQTHILETFILSIGNVEIPNLVGVFNLGVFLVVQYVLPPL